MRGIRRGKHGRGLLKQRRTSLQQCKSEFGMLKRWPFKKRDVAIAGQCEAALIDEISELSSGPPRHDQPDIAVSCIAGS
jgi:hypothetical protein